VERRKAQNRLADILGTKLYIDADTSSSVEERLLSLLFFTVWIFFITYIPILFSRRITKH